MIALKVRTYRVGLYESPLRKVRTYGIDCVNSGISIVHAKK